jgi:hypothetical protein
VLTARNRRSWVLHVTMCSIGSSILRLTGMIAGSSADCVVPLEKIEARAHSPGPIDKSILAERLV